MAGCPRTSSERAGEALVRLVAVATCDLDAEIIAGWTPFAGPFAFGHEFVAEVLEVGSDVHHVCPGQLAVVPFQISCGECARCRRGLTANCTAVPNLSMYGFGGNRGGALSDVVRVQGFTVALNHASRRRSLPVLDSEEEGDPAAEEHRHDHNAHTKAEGKQQGVRSSTTTNCSNQMRMRRERETLIIFSR